MTANFVHLRLHSEYSLVDGIVRIKPLVKRVAESAMPAVAITDVNNLFAMIKFYKAALAAGVKPIVGAELAVEDPTHGSGRVLFLCQNLNGYRQLARLVSRAHQEGGVREQPVVKFGWLEQYNDGLIAISCARDGPVGQLLLIGKTELAEHLVTRWQALFPERFFLELVRTGRSDEQRYEDAAIELAAATGTPPLASNDVRFLQADDFEAHEARVCIHQGRQLADPNRPRNYSEEQYLKTPEAMAELFADLPEALENTVEIAKRCNLELRLGHSVLPDFPVPEGMSADDYFEQRSRQGLEQRLASLFDVEQADFADIRKPYDERLRHELDVIRQMGYPGYFLIVADFIDWARNNGVPVGPGRGSGAGSLVAYSLGITDLDPLTYDLLFERFLNPERVSMPDFDIDFCMEGRDRVIDYVADRYGRDRVSQIATHGTMAARAVVRDVGRVLGHPYGFVDRIAKLIPFKPGVNVTLNEALAQEEDFRKAYEGDEEVRGVVDLAKSLEGLARNVGKHAGGVVIAPSALTDFSPLYCEPGSASIVTQFDKDDVEAVGLVKFDFLGLRTLTILDWALATVNRQAPESGAPPLDINSLTLEDPATYELLKSCQTTAVFQLESRGIRDLIRRLQPDRFEDIVALVALFRPGPLQSGMVDDFIDRKHGRAVVEYPHPELQPILEPTYGVILYQEQVMQIAQVLANYTLGGADLLRRAMGKKKPEEMAQQREVFLAGATERGVASKTAAYIFDLMEKFAGYGFNRSHSAAYALVSYQTAWLKAHHPAAFMAAVLSSDMDNTDKIVVLIDECRRMQLAVAAPSINHSEFRFTVNGEGEIVYGLGSIKGVGESAIETLVAERRASGPFVDLFDLCRRADPGKLNKRVLESLIRAGALDALGVHRAALMTQLADATAAAEQGARADSAGQTDLFGLPETAPEPAGGKRAETAEWSEEQRLNEEKKALGLYLSGHPIERYAADLQHIVSGSLAEIAASSERSRGDRSIVLAGLVVDVRKRQANRGGRIAFVTLDDRSARMEVRVFAEAFEQYREAIAMDEVLVVQGALSYNEFSDSMQINAERLLDIDSARNEYADRLLLRVDAGQFGNGLLSDLETALTPFRRGRCPVVVEYSRPGAQALIDLAKGGWQVQPADDLLGQLRELLGMDGVRIEYR